jgi:hypothetical protein
MWVGGFSHCFRLPSSATWANSMNSANSVPVAFDPGPRGQGVSINLCPPPLLSFYHLQQLPSFRLCTRLQALAFVRNRITRSTNERHPARKNQKTWTRT